MSNEFQEIKESVILLANRMSELQRHKKFQDEIINQKGKIVYITGVEDNGDWKRDDIIWMNDYAMDIFGNKIGGKCFEVFQGLHDVCEFCTNPELLDNPGQPIEWVFYNKKSSRLYFIVDTLVVVEGKKFRIEVAHDITELAKDISEKYQKYLCNEH